MVWLPWVRHFLLLLLLRRQEWEKRTNQQTRYQNKKNICPNEEGSFSILLFFVHRKQEDEVTNWIFVLLFGFFFSFLFSFALKKWLKLCFTKICARTFSPIKCCKYSNYKYLYNYHKKEKKIIRNVGKQNGGWKIGKWNRPKLSEECTKWKMDLNGKQIHLAKD